MYKRIYNLDVRMIFKLLSKQLNFFTEKQRWYGKTEGQIANKLISYGVKIMNA